MFDHCGWFYWYNTSFGNEQITQINLYVLYFTL